MNSAKSSAVLTVFSPWPTRSKQGSSQRRRVEKITQAILAKAFRGELVPTEAELARQEGRDYEPASAAPWERISCRAGKCGQRNAASEDHRQIVNLTRWRF